MKKTILALSFATLSAAISAATVESVIVRQMWPWSTDIKVEYQLSGVDASHPVDISVRAFNGGTEIGAGTLTAALSGQRYGVTDCVGTFTIDPTIAFGSSTVALGSFTVQLSVSDSNPNMNDILYKIVDLKKKNTWTDVTRKELMNGKYGRVATSFSEIDPDFSTTLTDVLIWLDVTNEVYKTDKMVFRRIPAGSFQFQKGIAAATNAYYEAGDGIKVSFSKDFYIGVFELTQQQYKNTQTANSNWNYFSQKLEPYRWTCPAECLYRNWNYADRPSAGANNKGGAAYALKSWTGLNVVLPTEAMWEYACRAGTDTFKYSGESGNLSSSDGFSTKVMLASGCNTGAGDSSKTQIVGTYKPNAWGLYDMLGNVREWCRDLNVSAGNFWKCACYAGEDNIDPTGPTAEEGGSNYVLRGGSYYKNPLSSGAMGRESRGAGMNDADNGVRLCITLENNDEGTL